MSSGNLFMNADEDHWIKALNGYKQSIIFLQRTKKKDINLQELDDWYKRLILCIAALNA